jgi:hypothetical protein
MGEENVIALLFILISMVWAFSFPLCDVIDTFENINSHITDRLAAVAQ